MNHYELIPTSQFDGLNNKFFSRNTNNLEFHGLIPLNIIYEKYAIPSLNYWELKQLSEFFKHEQFQSMPKEKCRKLLSELTDKQIITFEIFFKILNLNTFNILNPIHLQPCQNMNKSLVNYYVSTCEILKLTKSPINEKNILIHYNRLLSICRCFHLKLDWNDGRINILVHDENDNEMIGSPLKTLLENMVKYGFNNNQWPIILILKCENLIKYNKMLELVKIFNETMSEQQIFKAETNDNKICLPTFVKNSNPLAWPSLKSLCNKFIIIVERKEEFFMTNNANNTINKITTTFSSEFKDQNQLSDKQYPSFSIDSKRFIKSVKNYMKDIEDDSIASSTSKAFTWIENNDSDDNIKPIDLLRMGVQCVPYNADDIGRSYFDIMNGSCGYVMKPSSLRKGKMYCIDVSEDSALSGEPSAGPTRFMLTLICMENLKFDQVKNPMKCQIKVHIIGHHLDDSVYETKISSAPGQIPFWNEQFRPVIRLPNFTFLRFEVYNCSKLIATRTLPFKSIIRGIRFIEFDNKSNDGCNEKYRLFIQTNFKKIASCWAPDFDNHQPSETISKTKQQQHLDSSLSFSEQSINFIDDDNDNHPE